MKHFYICDNCHVDKVAPICRERGYGIEIQRFFDPAFSEKQSLIDAHAEAIRGIDNRCLHGPFCELVPGSMDSLVRSVARDRYEQAISVAGQLGIRQFVLHHNYYPNTSPPAEWTKRFIKFWQDFLEDKPADFKFHLENSFEHDEVMMVEAVRAIDDDRVDICLDIGHANCLSRITARHWIERLGDMIGYVHIHNNHGEKDEHLPPGKGTMNVVEVCQALEEHAPNAIWTLEVIEKDIQECLEWLWSHDLIT